MIRTTRGGMREIGRAPGLQPSSPPRSCNHLPMNPVETASPVADDGFATLGLDERLLQTLAALGYEEPTPIQLAAIPPLLEGRDLLGRGADRHRQDRGVRAAAPPAARGHAREPTAARRRKGGAAARARPRAHPRARDAGRRGDPPLRPRARRAGPARLRRPADQRAAPRARARRRRRGRDARPRARPPRAAGRSASTRSRPSCSTRPTRCSTWASPRTSRRSSARCPRRARRRCSPPRCRPASRGSPERHLQRPGPRSRSHAERAAAGEAPRVRQVAYVVRRADKLAALGRILDLEDADARRSSSPAPAARSTTSRRRSAAAAATPRRSTAAYAGAARPDHGPLPRRRARRARRHRRRRPRPRHRARHPRRQLRRARRRPRPTCTASAGPAGPVARASRSPSSSRASTGCCATSSASIGRAARDRQAADRRRPARAAAGAAPRRRCARRSSGDDLDRYRAVVESLSDEFDLVDIALAAVSLADARAARGRPRTELPTPSRRRTDRHRRAGARSASRDRDGSGRPRRLAGDLERPLGRPPTGAWDEAWAEGRPVVASPTRTRPRRACSSAPAARRGSGPSDLVGAIANEAGLAGADIGAIQIADGFSLVEVPEAAADRVIAALRAGTLKGHEGQRPARASRTQRGRPRASLHASRRRHSAGHPYASLPAPTAHPDTSAARRLP